MNKTEKIKYISKNMPHIIKSIYFCARILPWKQAIKVPIIIHCGVKYHIKRGNIILDCKEIKPFFIRIGLEGSEGIQFAQRGYLKAKDGKLIFKGEASLARGSSVRAENGATIEFGNHTHMNSNTVILSRKGCVFGEDVLFGWNVMVLDNDGGHKIEQNGKVIASSDAKIYIGNHVWVGADSKILKGAEIGDGSVVASGSIVNKKFTEKNLLICGSPAKCKKKNYSWIN